MLYDAYGRPVRTQQLTRELAAPTLAGIRTVWNETVASGLTPQRLAALLVAAGDGDHDEFLTLAEEMEERDLHYACELGKRKLAVSRLPITVEAASDASRDQDIADAVRELTGKNGFRWMLKDCLDALGKGFSVVEILWDRTSSTWWPSAYEWRDPRWFVWDRVSRRQIRLRDAEDLANGVELAPYKFIRHTPRVKSGIPIRSGFARLAAWAYMCKGYTVKDWLAFAEVFGMPLRMGKYHAGATPDEKEILKLAVANLGTDAAAIFPQGMEMELVEAQKTGSQDFFKILADWLDAQLSKGILGQTASATGTPGKLGDEKLQGEVREDIRDDDAEQLEDTLARDLVRPFVDLNFGPQKAYPQLQLRAVEQEDIETLSAALERLVPLGLRVEASVIRDKLGLPDPAEGAELLTAPAAPAPAPASEVDAAALNRLMAQFQRKLASALNRAGGPPVDPLDEEADAAAAEWEPMLAPVVDPIQDALAASETREEFEARLAAIVEAQDVSALVSRLAEALFRARVEGLSRAN